MTVHSVAPGYPAAPLQQIPIQQQAGAPQGSTFYLPVQPVHAVYSHPAITTPQPLPLHQPQPANTGPPPSPNPGLSSATNLASALAAKMSALSVSVANQTKPVLGSIVGPGSSQAPGAIAASSTTPVQASGFQPPTPAANPVFGSAPVPVLAPAAPAVCMPDGPPNEYPPWCVSEDVTYDAVWYQDKLEQWLVVCGRCWVDHILLSVFASQFERVAKPRGSRTRCRFHTPRVKDALWPRALSERNYEVLRHFAKTRSKIPDCPEFDVDTSKPKACYVALDGSMNGGRFCSACFEDRLVTAGFGDKFRISTPNPSSQEPACSFADDGLKDALTLFAKTPNGWSSFTTAVTNRLTVARCKVSWPYPESPPRQFTTKQPIDDWSICESCYLGNIAYHPFAAEFREVLPRPTAHVNMVYVCDAQSVVGAALAIAKRANSFATFWNAVAAISRQPRCVGTGMPDATWYTLRGNVCPDLDVCGACHAGVLTTLGSSRRWASGSTLALSSAHQTRQTRRGTAFATCSTTNRTRTIFR